MFQWGLSLMAKISLVHCHNIFQYMPLTFVNLLVIDSFTITQLVKLSARGINYYASYPTCSSMSNRMCISARYPSRVVVMLLAAYHPASRRQHDLAWRHFPVLLCCLGTFRAQYMLFHIPFLRVSSHYCLLYEFSKLLGQESRFSWLAIVSLRLR